MEDPGPEQAPLTRAHRRSTGAGAAAIPDVAVTPFRPLVTFAVVALSLLLAVCALAGPILVMLAVLLAGGVVAWGWAGMLGLPSPRGTAAVLAFGTAALVASVALTGGDRPLRWMPAGFAVAIIAAFVHQLVRRDGRPRLVESIASAVAALALLGSGACLVPMPAGVGGGHVVAVAMAAVAASTLVDLLEARPLLRAWMLPLGMVVGAGVGVAVGMLAAGIGWVAALLLGVATAGVSHALRWVLAPLPTMAGARSQLASAAVSVLACGVAVYVIGRIFAA